MSITDITQEQQGRELARRDAYIKGLRALADALEQNPGDLPLPYEGNVSDITFHFLSAADPRAEMAAAARALPCNWRKNVSDYTARGGEAYFDLKGELHGVKVELTAYRADVCERVVTGTREVTEKVKDPEALAAVPEVEVTRTVEDVEWVCHPVMAPQATGDAA